MKVLIECEEDNELEVVIRCNKIDDGVRRIISLFEDKHFIIGKLDNRSYQIKIDDIYYVCNKITNVYDSQVVNI